MRDMHSGETELFTKGMGGCGKGRTKINLVPVGGREVKMRRKGEIAGHCDYVLCLQIVVMNRPNNNSM